MRSPFLGIRKKSSWNPKPSKKTTLESFIDLVTNDVQTAVSTNIPTHNNPTPAVILVLNSSVGSESIFL
jgi:hypothetical protein